MIGSPRTRAVLAGALAAACLGGLILAFPRPTSLRWRQAATDTLLAAAAGPPSGRVVVVRIDPASLDALGSWPWPRDRLASLVAAIAAQAPAAIGIDLLLRQPGEAPNAPNPALIQALAQNPVALGALLTDQPTPDPPKPPAIALLGPAPPLTVWQAAGAALPQPGLMQAAPGLGSISLEVATDGVVRTVPIFVRAGPHLLPGLAVELVRLATHASTYLLRETTLQIGPETVPLGPDARLTIRPTTAASWPDRTVSAIAALSGHTGFEGRIVLIGAGPPAIGTFWRTPASADAPSVQIQADAVETLLSGHIPHRPSWAAPTEIAATALLALLAISAAVELAPVIAVAAAAAACLLYAAAASAALLRFDIILDPVTPALLGIAVAATAGLVAVSEARRAARRLRNRFEQHLAPAIVARIAAQPGLERIAGERRDVTALFTDLEGFTAATERMDPAVLVAILNRYFDIVVRTVIDHDGTVDKIIGDAVLAIFNAPTDLPDHPTSAVRCALALAASTREFASDPANDGLGQTRIGIETGEALVGEVGGDGKLNYTAHGAAINTAARLQSLNKQTGSTICVGPACRARIQTIAFRSLGSVDIRGSGPLEAFSPEPTPSLPRPAPSPIS